MHKSSYNHPFHLVTISPWPLLCSFSLMMFLLGSIKWFHEYTLNLLIWSLSSLLFILIQWWRDIIRESTIQGFHTIQVAKLLRMGMILFIISEIFFFISFFWTFFHLSLSPNIELGESWPPSMLKIFYPYSTPLLNTIILLSSGISITISHYNILNSDYLNSMKNLSITIILGLYFSILQFFEYKESFFTIADSSYGSIFFLITGFHGIHVIIGTTFIFITFLRLKFLHFSYYHHFGFEASSWYWHFVDVVWLFVYIFLYWWSFCLMKLPLNF